MTDNFSNMRNFLHIYFSMDYDIFGNNIDEIVSFYAYDEYLKSIERVISEFVFYLENHSDDTDDVFFDKTFGYCYLYTDDYANSVEFLRDVLSKLIFYRDQRLKEEAAAKGK